MRMTNNSKKFDLCVVGAGIFGSTAAKYASAYPSVSVCLIGPEEPTLGEWKYRMILGSHYDEGRIISDGARDEVYNILTQKSINEFLKLDNCADMKIYNSTGRLFLSDKDNSSSSDILNQIKTGNTQWLDLSSQNLLSKRFPFMNLGENEYALLNTCGGYVSPRKLLQVQKKVATKQGCHIIHDIVIDIKEDPSGILKVITEKHGLLNAKKVLVCAGAFTNFIPFVAKKKLDITVNKETYVLIKISTDEANRLSTMPPISVKHKRNEKQPNLYGAYILPPIKYPDGKYYLKIGHNGSIVDSKLNTLEEIRDWYHSNGEKYVLDFYTDLLQNILPNLEIEEIIGKTCVTCSSPSGYPYIDYITPAVTIAAVGNGLGVAICEEVARIAVCLSFKGIWDSELLQSKFKVKYKNLLHDK